MEDLLQIVRESSNDFSMETCQLFLDQPYSQEHGDLCDAILDLSILANINNVMKNLCVDTIGTSDGDVSTAILLKRLSAHSLYSAMKSKDTDVILASAQVVLSLSTLPSASAFGLCSSNMLSAVVNTMAKPVAAELKKCSKPTTSTSTIVGGSEGGRKVNSKASGPTASSTPHVKGTRSSSRIKKGTGVAVDGDDSDHDEADAPTSQTTGTAAGRDVEEELAQEEEEDQDGGFGPASTSAKYSPLSAAALGSFLSFLCAARPKEPTAGASAAAPKTGTLLSPVVTPHRSMVLQLIFAARQDEHISNTFAEFLSSAFFLACLRHELAACAAICKKCLLTLAVVNKDCMLAIYRALTPILSLQGRNQQLADVFKVRKICHHVAIQVVVDLIEQTRGGTTMPHMDEVEWAPEGTLGSPIPRKLSHLKQQQEGDEAMTTSPRPSSAHAPEGAGSAGSPMHCDDNTPIKQTQTGASPIPNSSNQPQQSQQQQQPLPFALTCVVGMLQRMTLSPPDRAQSRQLVYASLQTLLGALAAVSTAPAPALHQQQDNDDVDDPEVEEEEYVRRGIVHKRSSCRSSTSVVVQAVAHYLRFLSRLSRSSRIGHRAFCLEIAAQLLCSDWLWSMATTGEAPEAATGRGIREDDGAGVGGASGGTSAEVLVGVLLDRCKDCAPTVRLRAVAALHDLLVRLDYSSTAEAGRTASPPLAMMQVMYDAAMGVFSDAVLNTSSAATTTTSSHVQPQSASSAAGTPAGDAAGDDGERPHRVFHASLIDVLRERCADDRSLVRSRAVQALGKALAMPWPNPLAASHNTTTTTTIITTNDAQEGRDVVIPDSGMEYVAEDIPTVQMLVSEDDLDVLATHCRDTSVSARKHAVHALSELMIARPADALVQEIWIQHVLPLCFDSESTVAAKVAEAAHSVLFVQLASWYQDNHSQDGHHHHSKKESHFLLWNLTGKVIQMGLLKVLKSTIGLMMKIGILKAVPKRNGGDKPAADSILGAVEMLKTACCHHISLQQQQSHKQESSKVTSKGTDAASTAIQQFRVADAAEVSRGAWALLEAIVSQDSLYVLETIQQVSIPLQTFIRQAGSADFVVHCYKQKHLAVLSMGSGTTGRSASHGQSQQQPQQQQQLQQGVMWDEEDMRIFLVLEKLGGNLEAADVSYMRDELLRGLLPLQVECHIASAAIAVLQRLSLQSLASDAAAIAIEREVAKWSAQLLEAAEGVLQTFVFQQQPQIGGTNETARKALCWWLEFTAAAATTATTNSSASASGEAPAGLVGDKSADAGLEEEHGSFDGNNISRISMLNDSSTSAAPGVGVNTAVALADREASVAAATAVMHRMVQSALFVMGELSMLGFSMEEDSALRSRTQQGNGASISTSSAPATAKEVVNNAAYKLPIPASLVNLVRLLMGHDLPVNRHNASVAAVASSMGTAPVRECPQKIRANAFVAMGKLCMRDKALAREHVNIFLREITLSADSLPAGTVPMLAGSTAATAAASAGLDVSSLSRSAAAASADSIHSGAVGVAAAAVRSNALLVLGDMCVRYTHLVDRHVDTMACCLQDPEPLVRKHALILLTQLLLQDFLKWKGFLLYRFLVLIVDRDPEIAELARNVLQKTLVVKFPHLLLAHFSEALVVLNHCVQHPVYLSTARTALTSSSSAAAAIAAAAAAAPPDSGSDELDYAEHMASISTSAKGTTRTMDTTTSLGLLTRGQRFAIYAFMAESLEDEGRIQVCAKVVQDILASAVDNDQMMLGSSSSASASSTSGIAAAAAFDSLLEDTLALLRSPFLKVGSKRAGNAGDGDDDLLDHDANEISQHQSQSGGAGGAQRGAGGIGGVKAAFMHAKAKVLKKLSSQHLVSHTLPVVMSLKHCLEKAKSPLQRAVMEYLVALMKNHKAEVEEVLSCDPGLRSEVEYDLKVFERERKERMEAAAMRQQQSLLFGAAAAPSTVHKSGAKHAHPSMTPYLDVKDLPTRSIVKPTLRKSLLSSASSASSSSTSTTAGASTGGALSCSGGSGGANGDRRISFGSTGSAAGGSGGASGGVTGRSHKGRTPLQALRSAGMSDAAVYSALCKDPTSGSAHARARRLSASSISQGSLSRSGPRSAAAGGGGGSVQADESDDMERLIYSQTGEDDNLDNHNDNYAISVNNVSVEGAEGVNNAFMGAAIDAHGGINALATDATEQALDGDDDVNLPSRRRRSWGVVVDSLVVSTGVGMGVDGHGCFPTDVVSADDCLLPTTAPTAVGVNVGAGSTRYTPAKKRTKASSSPASSQFFAMAPPAQRCAVQRPSQPPQASQQQVPQQQSASSAVSSGSTNAAVTAATVQSWSALAAAEEAEEVPTQVDGDASAPEAPELPDVPDEAPTQLDAELGADDDVGACVVSADIDEDAGDIFTHSQIAAAASVSASAAAAAYASSGAVENCAPSVVNLSHTQLEQPSQQQHYRRRGQCGDSQNSLLTAVGASDATFLAANCTEGLSADFASEAALDAKAATDTSAKTGSYKAGRSEGGANEGRGRGSRTRGLQQCAADSLLNMSL